MYIDKDLIEDKLYELTDEFSVRKLTLQILILYNNICQVYDANGKTFKILFVSNFNLK